MPHRSVLFVGSFPYKTVDDVFDTVGRSMDGYVTRLPDGEAQGWIMYPRDALAKTEGLTQSGIRSRHRSDLPAYELFRIADGAAPGDLRFPPAGYDEIAKRSFAIFKARKAAGKIANDMRFQVSLPTPFGVIGAFVVPEDAPAVLAEYEREVLREADAIVAAIPAEELAIQWDIAPEIAIGLLDMRGDRSPLVGLDFLADAIARVTNHVPSAVQTGLHFCYGNPGGRHVVEPDDMGLMVRFANAITSRLRRPLNWAHMPVPIYRTDYAYFGPLHGLRLQPETEFYLGLVHMKDGLDGARKRMEAASKFWQRPFGIAYECGFRLFDPAIMQDVLKLHRDVADQAL